MNANTTSLYAIPSFAQGIASLLDVMGQLHQYNTSMSEEEADYNALFSDWQVIGDDIGEAMNDYSKNADEQ